jgi:hypothetical protein
LFQRLPPTLVLRGPGRESVDGGQVRRIDGAVASVRDLG